MIKPAFVGTLLPLFFYNVTGKMIAIKVFFSVLKSPWENNGHLKLFFFCWKIFVKENWSVSVKSENSQTKKKEKNRTKKSVKWFSFFVLFCFTLIIIKASIQWWWLVRLHQNQFIISITHTYLPIYVWSGEKNHFLVSWPTETKTTTRIFLRWSNLNFFIFSFPIYIFLDGKLFRIFWFGLQRW